MKLNLFSISVLLMLLVVTACSSNKSGEADNSKKEEKPVHGPDIVTLTADQYKSVGVQVGNVALTNLSNYVKASGSIYVPPQQLVSITSPYGGIIRRTAVLEGRYIGLGQMVVELENPEFLQIQQDYLESSSQLSFLKQDMDRQQQLVNENIAARKSLQKVTSEYNGMEARVEGLKAKLRGININASSVSGKNLTARAAIYSPQPGYITKVYTNVGKYVNANETIADLTNTDNLLVRINVFEKDITKISLGQTIRFTTTGDTAEQVAQVQLIGKDIHDDRTIEVQARVINPTKSLLPGMFVNAILEIGKASTPALPQRAIVKSGDKNYLFVLVEDKTQHTDAPAGASKAETTEAHYGFRRVEVGIGVTENGYTAVILPDGFDMNAKVITSGAYDLLSKMTNSGEEE